MFKIIRVGLSIYRIYGPHVYIPAPENKKYLFSDATYWQPTDIPIEKIACLEDKNSV